MRYEKKTRSLNFLLELLIVIVFFALACLICIPILVNANNNNKLTQIKNEGLLKLESIAEKMRVYNGKPLNEYLSGCIYTVDDQCLITDLDNDLLGDYQIIVILKTDTQNAGIFYDTQIRLVSKNDDTILIELNTQSYRELSYE